MRAIEHFESTVSWARAHERHLSALSLAGGFAFDSYTFGRIDRPMTQAVFILYLIAAGVDVQAGSNLVFGGTFSYADSTAKIATGPGRIGSTSYQGVAYARYSGDGWFVDGFAGSGSQSVSSGSAKR